MGRVDREAIREGVKAFKDRYNAGVPLEKGLERWASDFDVKEDTVRRHLREMDSVKVRNLRVYLND